jgi:hypothetical protein
VRAYRGTFPYEKALRKRRVWVEPLFAEAKDRHGMRRFKLRRLGKVNQEALLTAAGQNVKRLVTFGRKRPRRPAQVVALRLRRSMLSIRNVALGGITPGTLGSRRGPFSTA